jgi:hypothetical protein
MNKPYYRYSEAERAALTEEQLNDAIRIEAIERGITPPITLPESLQKQEFNGFSVPPKSICVYMACPDDSVKGCVYLDEEKAQAALEGVIYLRESGFSRDNKWVSTQKIDSGRPHIKKIFVSDEADWKRSSILNVYEEPDDISAKFKELADECLSDYQKIRQEIYNSKVRAEKKKEYIRLAQGDEEIAKAFWQKVEIGSWPV